MKSGDLTLSLDQARRLAVRSQHLAGPRPAAGPGTPGLDLQRAGWARPVRVEGGTEQWWAHRDMLARLDEDWVPRTTLLSPFDNLICDRDRTERLLSFAYRNEMYVPKATDRKSVV